MITGNYVADRTALLIVDSYNDFMSEGGKLFDAIKETADASGMFDNLPKILPAVRSAGIQVFIVPHHRSRPEDFDNWQHVNMFQKAGLPTKAFEVGSWGGEFNPEFGPQKGDVIIKEHWAQSGFANADLDLHLKQHGIQKIVLVGVIANSLDDKSAEAMTHEGDWCASRGLWRLVGRAQVAAEAAKRFSIGVSSVVRWSSAFGSPVASPPGQWAWTRNSSEC
jgi:nicotinamidase-related amidase